MSNDHFKTCPCIDYLFRSLCHEFCLFLCHLTKSHPGRLSLPHLAAQVVLVLALWLTLKPKLSLLGHSEQRQPQYHQHQRERCQAQGQGEAAVSTDSHLPASAPAQHPRSHQTGYQPPAVTAASLVHLLLAHWTLLASLAQTRLPYLTQAKRTTNTKVILIVLSVQVPMAFKKVQTHHHSFLASII